MTPEEYYPLIDQALAAILENIEKIVLVSQGMLILFCAVIIYYLFWGMRR